MRTTKCVAIVLTAALIGSVTVPAASGQASAGPRISNTREADYLVRITVDPDVFPLNQETLERLLHGPAVTGKAIEEVLGPDAAGRFSISPDIEWLSELADSSAIGGMGGMAGGMMGGAGGGGTGGGMMGGGGGGGMGGGAMAGMGGVTTTPAQDSDTVARGMGATGGMVGGVVGGRRMSGVGGMGGGMMGGGMGGMGDGGLGNYYGYRAPTDSASSRSIQQRATIRLTVRLGNVDIKPVAKELLDAIVENLRGKLLDAHKGYESSLKELLTYAVTQRDQAERSIQSTDTAAASEGVREQLDQIVDLSALSPDTPLSEAIEVLKNSVQPPLQIVALWKDLQEGANVEPYTTSIDIDGMSSVRLGTALDLLVKGISDPLPGAPAVMYRIQDNVIVIGTSAALGIPSASAAGSRAQVDIRTLAARKDELTRAIQSLQLDQVSMEARRKAMYMQIEEIRTQAAKKLAEDTVTQELEKLVQISTSHLELLQQRVAAGQMPQAELASAQEGVARARIELARRREELSKLTGGGRIEQYDTELSEMAIDEAESRARLDVLRRQLADVQGQLTQASTFDPEAARIRIAQETLDIANRRVGELEARIANLQPPTVTVIGAN